MNLIQTLLEVHSPKNKTMKTVTPSNSTQTTNNTAAFLASTDFATPSHVHMHERVSISVAMKKGNGFSLKRKYGLN